MEKSSTQNRLGNIGLVHQITKIVTYRADAGSVGVDQFT